MSKMMKLFNVPAEFVTRKHTEKDELPLFRNEFMRDRDRLMYATAFRRLAGKTQIYTVGSDDHKKNRLTHSLEVAQIARTIARALGLNEDLTEAIALGHDFGHTPFGHAGEEMLNSIMIPNAELVKGSPFYHKSFEEIESRFQRECRNDCDKKEGQSDQVCFKKCENLNEMFGFKHNHQSVRVCAVLEDSYRDNGNNIGLNLTNYVLCGMMLHTKQKYDGTDYPNYQNALSEHVKIKDKDEQAWSFEAYIVSRADDIAQWHHDLEDAIREGVLPPDKICETVKSAIGDAMDDEAKKDIEELRRGNNADRYSLARLSHIVVNTLVNDLVSSSEKRFEVIYEENLKKNSVDGKGLFSEYEKQEFSIARDRVIDFSEKIKPAEFKEKIREAIHHSRNVERMNEKGKYIIRKLFEAYYAHPQQLTDGAILQVLIESGQKGYETIEDAQKHSKGESRILFDKLMKNPNIMVETILMRRICDHIASMTDHYAIEEYNNLYG